MQMGVPLRRWQPWLSAALVTLVSFASPLSALAQEETPAAETSSAAPAAPAAEEAAPAEAPAAETAAAPTPEEQAAAAAAEAKVFYKEGKYVEALAAFKKAHGLNPTAALTYNIARCHERLSQWEEAISWYDKYTKLATDPRDKTEALDKIELLKRKLGPQEGSADAQFNARLAAGRKAYSRGDYEAAIEEFKAAFDIKAEVAPLYNIAKCYEKLGRYEEALEYFQQYLDLSPTASDRADVEELMRRLRKSIKERFQELSISSEPPGAEIRIDDRNSKIIGQTNYRHKLTPGPHTIYLDLNGYEPVKSEFIMPDDKPLALDFKLKKLENVGFLLVNVDQDGARIFVDGAIVGLSPFKQKKALAMGKHQVQIELSGYDRYIADIDIKRDEEFTLNAQLKKYDEPVSDDTLSSWGRNLMLIGIIGGGLGFAGPIVYQQLVDRRSYYDQLGAAEADGRPFYKGPVATTDPNYIENDRAKTFETIQMISVIAGGTLTLGGFSFYLYKWIRDVPPKPVALQFKDSSGQPLVEITNFGIVPGPDGSTSVGLGGRF